MTNFTFDTLRPGDTATEDGTWTHHSKLQSGDIFWSGDERFLISWISHRADRLGWKNLSDPDLIEGEWRFGEYQRIWVETGECEIPL